MKTKITLIIISLFYTTIIFSQNSKIDSLKNIISTTENDTIKLYAYEHLTDELKYQHPDTNKLLFEEAILFAKEKKNKLSLANLYNNRGISFGVFAENDSCIFYLKKAINLFENIDTLLPQLSSAYNNVGSVYRAMGYFNLSIKYQLKAVKFAENTNDIPKIASRLNNLAATFFDMEEYKKALHYALQSNKYFIELPESFHKINNLIALGSIYNELQINDTALYFLQKSEKFAKQLNYTVAMPDIYNTLGSIYFQIKQYEKAEQMYNFSLNYCDSLNNTNMKFYPYLGLSQVFRNEKNYAKNYDNINEILQFADSLDNIIYKTKGYQEIYLFYKTINETEKALIFSELYKQWSDTLLNQQKHKQIDELNIIYETEKKEQQIEIQTITISKQKQKITYTILVIIIVLLLSAMILYFWLNKRRAFNILFKQNQQIVIQQKLLEDKKLKLENEIKQIKTESKPEKTKKYQTSKLDDNKKQQIWETITELFEKQKIYLDPVLSINKLTEKTNSNKTYISQIISEFSGEHFNNFVNLHRINDARKILSEPQNNIQIKTLHSEVGFKSKTTFYNSFKKFTGFSPTEYRNRILRQNS